MWYVLPLIRKTLARQLVENHGMTQAEVARRLSITDAAVSQYLSGKRADREPDVSSMRAQFKKAATVVARARDEESVQREICRLCRYATENCVVERMAAQKKRR